MRPRSGRHQECGHLHQPSLRRGVGGSWRAPGSCSERRRWRAPRRTRRGRETRPGARTSRASPPKRCRSPDPTDGGRVGAGNRLGGAVAGWPSAGGVTSGCAVADQMNCGGRAAADLAIEKYGGGPTTATLARPSAPTAVSTPSNCAPYAPRRPDFADVACGLLRGAGPRARFGCALAGPATRLPVLPFDEKSGMALRRFFAIGSVSLREKEPVRTC